MTAIEKFLRDHYTDEKLAALLAHAQDGKLSYISCCCFIGVATADHALTCRNTVSLGSHYIRARYLEGALTAEREFRRLGTHSDAEMRDAERREKLIPLILAEMARRSSLTVNEEKEKEKEESVSVSVSVSNGVR